MIKFFRVALCFLYLWGNVCSSQTLFSNVKYQVETGSFLSTSGVVPFWLRSNQYGIVPLHSPILTFRGSAHKEYDSTENNNQKLKKFGIGYGFWGVANVGKQSGLLLPEAYLKVRYGAFEFYGGRRREIIGLVDTTLTSGSYIWSGNALPIPKIQISIPNYTSIIGHGLVSIKGGYAHGWFGSSDSAKKFFLHQKYLYGRIGKPNWKIKFYGGFNHQVQWGGKPIKPYIEKETGKLITDYGNNFNSYLNVITGVSLNTKGGKDIPGIPLNDAFNRSGNHLGSIDIATSFSLKNFELFLYRQSIYDDGSLFYLNNISDGLFGISLKKTNSKNGFIKFVMEYINTSNQGGNKYYDFPPQLRGGDNYFNNGLYTWIYANNTIGTPFIMPLQEINKEIFTNYDEYSKKTPQTYMTNNHVSGIFSAVAYAIKDKLFTTKFSYTNNNIDGVPIKISQFSILQTIAFEYKKYSVNSQVSFDSNAIFKENLGINLFFKRFF